MRRIIVLIFLTLPVVLLACTGTGGNELDRTLPKIDTTIPPITETATFALG